MSEAIAPAPRARAGRPRRTAAEADAVRAQLIEVAKTLFAREGFGAVSMRRIAAVAGCAPMTIYGYFRSKNEILRYVWEDFFQELFAELARAAAAGSAADRLRATCQAYLGYWQRHPDRYRMVYLNQDNTAPGERYYVDTSSVVERFAMFRDLIEAAQAAGSAHPGDAQRMGEALVCGLLGVAHALITIPEYPWLPGETLLDQQLRAVLLTPPT